MDISKLDKHYIDIINQCFLFKNIDQNKVMEFLSNELCADILFKKGSVIYDLENYTHSIGMILSGKAEVISPAYDCGEFIMNTLGEKDIFGVAAVFNDSREYVTRITAGTDCRVIFFSQEMLRNMMKENFKFTENYISFLSGRIFFLNKKISALSVSNSENAVVNWLSENYIKENGKYIIKLSVSISKLASMLNIGRASLYRAFDDLEKRGIIKKDGKYIEILDIEKIATPKRSKTT